MVEHARLRGAVTTPTKCDRLTAAARRWRSRAGAGRGSAGRGIAESGRSGQRRQHGVHEEPVAARGGDAPGAGVRAGDQPSSSRSAITLRMVAATGRARGPRKRCANRPAGIRDVAFDQGFQQRSWRGRPAWFSGLWTACEARAAVKGIYGPSVICG